MNRRAEQPPGENNVRPPAIESWPAFAEALSPHYDDALRYCHALVAQARHTGAEDLLQDAILKALRHYHQLAEPARFKAWFFRIITTLHRTAARRRLWRRFSYLTDDADCIPGVYRGHEVTVQRRRLLHALGRLSKKQRAAFLLFEPAGFSLEEIRIIQGDRSLSAVKSRLSRSRRKLRRLLDESGAEPVRHRDDTASADLEEATLLTIQEAHEALHEQ